MASRRILQVCGTASGGSWFLAQVKELRARGHHVEAITPGEGSLTEQLRSAGVRTHVVPFRGYRPADLPLMIRALFRIRRIALQGRFEIVHAHLFKAVVMCRFALLGRRNPKLVAQIAGVVHLDLWPLRLIDVCTLRKDTLTLGSCTAFADIYRDMGAPRVAINHYGMDTTSFLDRLPKTRERQHLGLLEHDIVVIMVAHMYPTRARAYRDIGVKGHEVYIDAARAALAREPRLCFLVVGDEFVGDGSYRTELEQRANGIAPGRFRFLGHRSDIAELLALSDVATNPSLSESASYTVMEASLAGIPVVVSCVGGLTDTVLDGVTGLVVPPADSSALAEAILRLAADPQARTDLGSRGRDHVQRTFDLTATIRKLDLLYASVLETT